MAKLRLLFVKEAQASYISNLDLIRTFQRVFPRCGLELKHSQGFHPHPLLSIVLPLPVGQSSDCELLDFEVEQDINESGVAEALNEKLPAGIIVRACCKAERPAKELAYLRARLALDYDGGVPDGTLNAFRELFSRGEVMAEKRTKSKDLVQINVAALTKSIEWAQKENSVTADVTVSAQRLNPVLLVNAASAALPDFAPDYARVRRVELYDIFGQPFR